MDVRTTSIARQLWPLAVLDAVPHLTPAHSVMLRVWILAAA
jgi:hypothetical protein